MLCRLSGASDGAADSPDADLAVGVAAVQGLAVCRPGQGHAEGDLRLLAQAGKVRLQLIHNALALQIPDLHTGCSVSNQQDYKGPRWQSVRCHSASTAVVFYDTRRACSTSA